MTENATITGDIRISALKKLLSILNNVKTLDLNYSDVKIDDSESG